MATLQITEFSDMTVDAQGRTIPVGEIDNANVVNQTVTYTSSAQSAALAKTTRFVRLIADADCHILAGSNPTATASHTRLEADVAEYFGVQKVGTTGTKIAAYDGTT